MDNNHLELPATEGKAQKDSENFPKNPPNEVVQHIFRFLSPESLAEVRLVNHFFRDNADALMEVASYWVGVLSRLESKAATQTMRALLKGVQLSRPAAASSVLSVSFHPALTCKIWKRAAQLRGLSDKILMAVRAFHSIDLAFLRESQEYSDFLEALLSEINDQLQSTSADTSRVTVASFMKLFIYYPEEHEYPSSWGDREGLCRSLSLPESLFDHYDVMLALVTYQTHAFSFASERLKNDHDFVLAAVHVDPFSLYFASEALQHNREIARYIVEDLCLDRYSRTYIDLLKIREIARLVVQKDISVFKCLDEKYFNDKEIVLIAVQHDESLDGEELCYASEALRNDREVVLASVQRKGKSLRFASDDLRCDREIVLAAVQNNGGALKYAGAMLRNDRDLVMTAVEGDAFSIIHASNAFYHDRAIILTAVQQQGQLIKFAAEVLKNDREVVLCAVQQYGPAIEFLGEVFKHDRDIVLAAIQQSGVAIKHVSETLKSDWDIALAATSNNCNAYRYIGDELKDNEAFIREAVSCNWQMLRYAGNTVREDSDVMLTALKESKAAMRYLGESLKQDADFLLQALAVNPEVENFINEKLTLDLDSLVLSQSPGMSR